MLMSFTPIKQHVKLSESHHFYFVENCQRDTTTVNSIPVFLFPPPAQLAKNVGNSSFNEIMEGNLCSPSPKPTPSSDM